MYGSDIALSVYGMMMKVYQIAHSMFVGVSSAVQPINGYNFGAKHFLRVRQTFRTAAAIALVISGVWFLVFQLFPRQIGMLFVSDSPLYLDCAQHCFRLYMAAFFLYGLHLATASFFQGIGRPVPSLAIPLARQGVFLIPLAILLIKMVMTDDTWHLVRNVRGVTGFVGSANKAIPLTEEEVLAMGMEKHEIVVRYNVGDHVKIVDGPLASFTGVVEEIEPEKNRVSVMVSMFGRETPVELELDQVEVQD